MARELAYFLKQRTEHICVVVGIFALQSHAQTLESHTGIYHLVGQRMQRTVVMTLVLHEHQVPDFYHLRMVFIDHLRTAYFGAFLVAAQINVNLRARAAGTRFAHFPEVIMPVSVYDVVLGQMFFPQCGSFVITFKAVGGISFKNSGIKAFGIEAQTLNQKFISPVNGISFEIVAKRPVAEHFEHCMVVCVVAHFLQVVVLAAYTQAFLAVGNPRFGDGAVA